MRLITLLRKGLQDSSMTPDFAQVRLLEFGYRGDQDLVLTRMADRRWRNESFWSDPPEGGATEWEDRG